MAAANISDSRNNSLTLPPLEKTSTGKSAQYKTRQTKNLIPGPSTNKRIADQVFHDVSTKLVPDSQLQNEVADLERRVLEARKAALQKQFQTLTAVNPASPTEELVANPGGARNSNFGLFYKHKNEKSHLVPFMHEYRSVDIQYICNIKINKFKPENIMKLSTSVRRTREAAKSLKIGTNSVWKLRPRKKIVQPQTQKVLFLSSKPSICIHKFLFFWLLLAINCNYS